MVQFGKIADIDEWINLVKEISWNFPGLETTEKIDEHRETVLRFISKEQALCAKDENEKIVGVLLFSRGHNMICFLGVSPMHRRCGIASCLLSSFDICSTVLIFDSNIKNRNNKSGYKK